ncbi:MAG TPA: hypothetical protein VG713_04850 [Pirellulales bacterium]|nr:hypothetical protein [Pirellulales bacterium]
MKRLLLTFAMLGLFSAAPLAASARDMAVTPDGTPVHNVGVVVPWRGWGVYRPYGAPLGYNQGNYGVYGYRGTTAPYYRSYSYRPYSYGGWWY